MKEVTRRPSVGTMLSGTAAALLLTWGSANAQTIVGTDTFQVTATVLAQCSVSAGNLGFGTYSPAVGTPTDATSTISVTCPNGQNYQIGLNDGQNSGLATAPGTTRAMTGGVTPGVDHLDYDLFKDTPGGNRWGNTFNVDTLAASGTGAAQLHTVHGRVPALQNSPPGTYADTVTVNVFF